MRKPDQADILARLTTAVAAREGIQIDIRRKVAAARDAGATWAEIGECLEVTGSAAQQKYGRASD